jgi:molecular chaperone GrpE
MKRAARDHGSQREDRTYMKTGNEDSEVVKPPSETSETAEEQTQPGATRGEAEAALPAALPSAEDLAAAYERLLAEKEELYDRLLRKQADFENQGKRLQREKEEHVQHANLELVRALLPVLDGFERALKHRDSSGSEQFFQGMELLYRNLQDLLKRAGLSPIETHGKLFDPHFHQAVETVAATGYRDQEIVEELQRGYKFKHRLLRPAIVRVAVAPHPALPADEQG